MAEPPEHQSSDCFEYFSVDYKQQNTDLIEIVKLLANKPFQLADQFIQVGHNYQEINVSGQAQYTGGDMNSNKSNNIALLLKHFFKEDPSKKSRNILKKLLKAFATEINIRLRDNLQQNALQVHQYLELPMAEQTDAVGRPQHRRIDLPPQMRAIAVFDRPDVTGRLLVLGEPGSGKTTTLVRLAQDLIERAQTNPDFPVPLIFELSSWKDDRLSLEQWMMDQLENLYSIRDRHLSMQWIERGLILPLLDGLDELGLVHQRLAIAKINAFLKQDVGRQMVVCCRSREYEEGQVRLTKLNGAYCLQPPPPEEIYRYLQQLGKLDLWEVLQTNESMGELAMIPLLLNVMVDVYQAEVITTQEQLFETYIDKKLEEIDVRRGKRYPYTSKQTRRWLTFLAQQLDANSQTEFLIENMQPNWLLNEHQKNWYQLIVWLIGGLSGWLIGRLGGGLISDQIYWLMGGLFFGFFFAILGGQIFGSSEEINPQQSLDLSLKKIKKAVGAMISGLFIGLYIGLRFGHISWVIFVSIVWVIINLNADIKAKEIPNQGIKLSLEKSLLISVIATPFFFLVPYLTTLVMGDFHREPFTFSIAMGIMVGLMTGGLPCIQHFALRLVLYKNGLSPWNYARFLRSAAQQRLIQQVGGRYRFIHDALRQQFVRSRAVSQQESIKLLASLVGAERVRRSPVFADQLCAWLGDLPLGLQLVGSYLAQDPDLSLEEMLDRLRDKSLEEEAVEPDEQQLQQTLSAQARRGLKAAFELSWQELDETAKLVAPVLSLFAPKPDLWTWDLVEKIFVQQPDDNRGWIKRVLQSLTSLFGKSSESLGRYGYATLPRSQIRLVKQQLCKRHLVERVDKGYYAIHPLIREFLRGKLEGCERMQELKRRFAKVFVEIAKQISTNATIKQIKEVPMVIPRKKVPMVIPHLKTVAENLVDALGDEDLIWPFLGLGRFYEAQSKPYLAKPWREKCVTIVKARLGLEHPDTALSLNNLASNDLASNYYMEGRFSEVEPLYLEALEISNRLLGTTHPQTAAIRRNLKILRGLKSWHSLRKSLCGFLMKLMWWRK